MKEALKQMLNDIDVGLKNALIRVNELVAENKTLKEALAEAKDRKFCARCGKRTADLVVFADLIRTDEREALEAEDWTAIMREGSLVTWGDAEELGERVRAAIKARGKT